jgi:hypothetical protein
MSSLLLQVSAIGRALFMEKQTQPLLPLLRLAGPAGQDPGLQFLQVCARGHPDCDYSENGAVFPQCQGHTVAVNVCHVGVTAIPPSGLDLAPVL